MNNLQNTQTLLSNDWIVGGTIAVPYPAGTVANDFGATGHTVATSTDATFTVSAGQVSFSFGASVITITNNARAIPMGTMIFSSVLTLAGERALLDNAKLITDPDGNITGLVGGDKTIHGFNLSLDRPPTVFDNTSKGYSASSVWQSKGQLYQPVGTPDANSSAWSVINTLGACPADIMGYSATWATSNSLFAGGLRAMVSGYVGALVDISVTISATPTAFTINCLATGEIDVLALQKAMSQADVATYVTVTRLYDQTGLGNHADKHASYLAPFIEYDSLLESYCIYTQGAVSSMRGLRFPTGVAATSGFALAGNSWTVIAMGRCLGSADSGNAVLVSLGDYITAPNKFVALQSNPQGIAQKWSTEQGEKNFGNICLDSKPCVIIATSGASVSTFSVNEYSGSNATVPSSQSYVSGWLFSDQPALTSRYSMMKLVGIVIAKTEATATQKTKIRNSAYTMLNIKPQSLDQVFLIGDSRTASAQPNGKPAETVGMALASQLSDNYQVYNLGTGSATNATLAANQVPTVVAKFNLKVNNYAVYLAGINDFIVSNSQPATVLSAIKANLLTLKNAGYNVILINELATTSTINSANTRLEALRALISSEGISGMGCDVLVDLNKYAPFATPANTAYYSDGLHPTSALNHLWASVIATLITPSSQVITV